MDRGIVCSDGPAARRSEEWGGLNEVRVSGTNGKYRQYSEIFVAIWTGHRE